MDTMLIAFLPFVFFFVVFLLMRRGVKCPECGADLPAFQSPFTKTRRGWMVGGFTCSRCGCEADSSGQKVAANSSHVRVSFAIICLLALALLGAVGLASQLLAKPVAAPPVAESPRAPAAFAPQK